LKASSFEAVAFFVASVTAAAAASAYFSWRLRFFRTDSGVVSTGLAFFCAEPGQTQAHAVQGKAARRPERMG